MQRRPQKKHGTKAAIAISAAIVLAVMAGVGTYVQYRPGRGTLWILLIIPALPLAAWGGSRLALHRGYPSAAGYAVFIVGFLISGLVAGANTPSTVGFGVLFVVIMPVVVLLALPKKPGSGRR